jgi:hypothetical protein
MAKAMNKRKPEGGGAGGGIGGARVTGSPYVKGGAKPSASVGSKLSKSKKYPKTANMEAKSAVKQGQLPKSFSQTNSPKQKTSPIKRKGK